MRRPITVRQDENDQGQFWYAVKAPNNRTVVVSEMFPSRSNAKRAARSFIRMLDVALPVDFSYFTGPLPIVKDPYYPFRGLLSTDTRTRVTEQVQ